jgi:hypothetical protein
MTRSKAVIENLARSQRNVVRKFERDNPDFVDAVEADEPLLFIMEYEVTPNVTPQVIYPPPVLDPQETAGL